MKSAIEDTNMKIEELKLKLCRLEENKDNAMDEG